jgi:AbrB family looped-hinge helix DNA binding protein
VSKVTSKLQVTIPKAVAERYRIRPGDSVDWVPAGDVIRLEPCAGRAPALSVAERLDLFDRATERQRQRDGRRGGGAGDRGWTREELYERGGPR